MDNPVVVPVWTHIRIILTSSDVIHSWAIPSLGVKIDAIPGRLNQTGVYVERCGVYRGMCSELCGINHGYIPIVLNVVTPGDFVE